MPSSTHPLARVKALAFDVFGTVVDWRSTVTEELYLRAFRKLSSPEIAPNVKSKLEAMREADWGAFTQAWRQTYMVFTRSFNPDVDTWKTVDEHHRDSLVALLKEHGLQNLFNDDEITSLSLVWHRLRPWPDSAEGISLLNKAFTTTTLSNGNTSLLQDLNDFGSLGFQRLLSAETFKRYKPHPDTYLGVANELGLEPGEVAMVAAHPEDLRAARTHGLATIMIVRAGEANSSLERRQEVQGWVDMWIEENEDGIVQVAKKLEGWAQTSDST